MSTPFREILKMADQFTPEAKQELVDRLLEDAETRELTAEEKQWLFESAISDSPIIGDYSDRREDWYGEDGR